VSAPTTSELIVPEVVAGVAVPEPVEVRLSSHDLAMIRRQVVVPENARPPTDVELSDFGEACMLQRLNPFDRQIYFAFINRRWTYFIGVHGRLVLALRTGEVTGMEGPLFCHKRSDEQRARREPPDWDELWDDNTPPHAAKFVVMRKGMTRYPTGTARWAEYGKNTPVWQDRPTLMLSYKAITRALNLTFPDVMPPDTGRDDDVDESVGYTRDDADRDADIGRTDITEPPARSEFIVSTREQITEMTSLLEQHDLAGPHRRHERLAVLGRALGRIVADTRDLDRADTARCIDFLRARLGTEPDDVR
jgi:hypothetical protein